MVSQKTTRTGSDVARVNKDEEPVPINDRIMAMRLPLQDVCYFPQRVCLNNDQLRGGEGIVPRRPS